MRKKIVSQCPVCEGKNIEIVAAVCRDCQTRIDAEIPIPPFFQLPEDLQEFVIVFLHKRGNIREMEKELGISYPTVCKKLDRINEILGVESAPGPRTEILERLERGEITAKEAAKLLKEK